VQQEVPFLFNILHVKHNQAKDQHDLPPTYIHRQQLRKRTLSGAIYTVVLSVAWSAVGQNLRYKQRHMICTLRVE
jgi:hypothetical protein